MNQPHYFLIKVITFTEFSYPGIAVLRPKDTGRTALTRKETRGTYPRRQRRKIKNKRKLQRIQDQRHRDSGSRRRLEGRRRGILALRKVITKCD